MKYIIMPWIGNNAEKIVSVFADVIYTLLIFSLILAFIVANLNLAADRKIQKYLSMALIVGATMLATLYLYFYIVIIGLSFFLPITILCNKKINDLEFGPLEEQGITAMYKRHQEKQKREWAMKTEAEKLEWRAAYEKKKAKNLTGLQCVLLCILPIVICFIIMLLLGCTYRFFPE